MSGPSELLDAVRAGACEPVPDLVRSLDAAGRKAALTELKALRAEVRGWGWNDWDKRRRIQRALILAGAGCHTGAAASAAWIGARDLRDWERLPHEVLFDLLCGVPDRAPEWLGDVAHRLAGRASTARDDYPLIDALVRRSGCEVPTTDAFVYGWVDELAGHGTVRELADHPYTRVLVPRLFETAELAGPLSWHEWWPRSLVALTAEGVVDRAEFTDRCVSRLLRGGKTGDLRFFLDVLRRLELTFDEERARTADWMGMAADAPSTVAGHAQAVLSRLAEAGGLSARALAEVSGAVLFRTEKKLVRAQLVLVGKALRRDRGGAPELLPVLAEAFGHEDTSVQERALKLVGRYVDAVGDEVRGELAEASARLSPVHRAAAAEVFGDALPAAEDTGPYEEVLPPVPERQRVAPVAGSLPQLVEEVVALLHSDGGDPGEAERALDGLVRFAYRDRRALADALDPLVRDLWWYAYADRAFDRLTGVDLVVAALVGKVTSRRLHGVLARQSGGGCVHQVLDAISAARAREAAWHVLGSPLPFLVATPTWHTGTIEPGDLVERLSGYRRLGAAPGAVDFAQALLRVRRTGPGVAEAAEAAALLGTREGERLAARLTAGGPSPVVERRTVEVPRPVWSYADRPVVRRIGVGTGEDDWIQRELPAPFQALGRPRAASDGMCHLWRDERTQWTRWTAVLPEDRERLAAWLLAGATAAADNEARDGAWFLMPLAEGGGDAGPSLHLALACGLGARFPEDRLTAVDALLVLAARGQLDAARLGADLAELVAVGTVKPNRLADSLRTAAATGAYDTIASVLGAALPGLLEGGEPARGLGEILAVAAECVERCGRFGDGADGGAAPWLEAAANRRGGSQVVVQARRLAKALGYDIGQRTPQIA
ncbi:DUF6493 family protein [Streptomyces sp. NPDC047928]|uniref:DUF7825 domain-containing protein n=1 Tax=unclassified Streptomyces TaxID=2593676 RepID=UPI00372369BF